MEIELSPQQIQAQENFRAFVSQEIAPYADQNDQQESTPPEIIKKLASVGYLGAIIPKRTGGGKGMDAITFGLFV
ncbi:hypothetical protein BGS_0683 [Beggiatoa sp. SS]|nr:hypothetical protein BGS_0683 [Beggiatoa sp. SS]